MLANEKEALYLLKWLSKAIIAINWFSGGVQAGIIVAEAYNPLKQDVNCTYIRPLEDVQDVFWTSYIRSIYVLCPGGCIQIN